MNRLFIVRHGDTFEPGQPVQRIGARTDLPLTANGIAQATRLGEMFATTGIVFAQAFAGSLARTRQTALLILSAMSNPAPVSTAAWLTEIDHGPDEGLEEEKVLSRLGPACLAAWDEDGIAPDGWKVDREARMRAWLEIADAPPIGDTLLVTSNGAARFALLVLDERSPGSTMKLRTGSFGSLETTEPSERSGRSGWTVTAWNVRPGDHWRTRKSAG